MLALDGTSAHAASFAGTGLGPIPDGAVRCAGPGAPLVVSFDVSGITVPIGTIGVRMQFSPQHTSVGDLHVVLAAPGGSPNMTLFGNTGTAPALPSGAISNAAGPYLFADTQTGDWWAAATAASDATAIPPGGYRTTGDGSALPTSMNFIFSGMTAAQTNGVWTLTFIDDCRGDT
ncbi:MAG TPA: hypothetical protein VF132_00480, partial [Rudaea sp.]